MIVVPAAVLTHAQCQADAFTELTGVAVDAEQLLGGRAALLGIAPRGRVSAGGSTRLMQCRDGWCALTLARDDDIATVPALLQTDAVGADPWSDIHRWAAVKTTAEVAGQARLLGLPVAVLGATPAAPPTARPFGTPTTPRVLEGLLVADLSSMWAGPLCGQLLARAGATVVKVESRSRPDGTRSGPPEFFDWMNAGKLSYAVDFDEPAELRGLLTAADVVIESSRPSALARRELGPSDITPRDGRVWVRITGHGADGAHANWVAFGDDAAVSGGLVGRGSAGPEFCGDAIADPLTGLHAAVAVAQSLRRGGGELIEFAMAAVAAGYAELPQTLGKRCGKTPKCLPAASLGADNATVSRLIAEKRSIPC